MPPRYPLSLSDLKDITARSAGDDDAMALLWEVRRLHLKLQTVYGSLPDSRPMSLGEIRYLQRFLKDEPCLEEQVKGSRSLF